jgi:hypothetical protein
MLRFALALAALIMLVVVFAGANSFGKFHARLQMGAVKDEVAEGWKPAAAYLGTIIIEAALIIALGWN